MQIERNSLILIESKPEKACVCKNCGIHFLSHRKKQFCRPDCRPRRKKHLGNCDFCKKPFASAHKETRFCSLACANSGKNEERLYAVNRSWLQCSFCLGAIGFGSKKAAALLNLSVSTVLKAWGESGFQAMLPKQRSWKKAVGLSGRSFEPISQKQRIEMRFRSGRWMRSVMAEYKREARANARLDSLPYSKLIAVHISSKIGREKYRAMTPDQRRERNAKCIERRKQIHGADVFARYQKSYKRKRMAHDPTFRLATNLRGRLWSAVKRCSTTPARWAFEDLVGCDAETLRLHLERQFKRWMTWDNYGKRWHVDHYVPCSRFDLTNDEEVRRCFHWSNLRPLCAIENVRRNAARGQDLQPQLIINK